MVRSNTNNIIEQHKGEKKLQASTQNAISVLKAIGLRIGLIELHKNAQIKKHSVKEMNNEFEAIGKIKNHINVLFISLINSNQSKL